MDANTRQPTHATATTTGDKSPVVVDARPRALTFALTEPASPALPHSADLTAQDPPFSATGASRW
jgi:hypothetical protein